MIYSMVEPTERWLILGPTKMLVVLETYGIDKKKQKWLERCLKEWEDHGDYSMVVYAGIEQMFFHFV